MRARLTSLQAKQGILNAKIQQQLRRPSPCWLRLQALKRQRLRVEDEISAIRRTLDATLLGRSRQCEVIPRSLGNPQ